MPFMFDGYFSDASSKRISVFGLGYVGLPVAAVLASRGFEVLGVDVSNTIVETINGGRIHIIEPDLDMVVQAAVSAEKLRASLVPEPADVFIIAVPTPFKEQKLPDLSYINAAVKAIAPLLRKGNLVVLESTAPAGTTDQIASWIKALRPDLKLPDAERAGDIYLAHCPERVLPGRVLRELVDNDRIIGGISMQCAEFAAELYRTFVRADVHLTNARTAELAKLVENSYRDVNIAFANELSLVCDRLGVNVWELISLANKHPRVNILSPGPGVGGHCIAVDPWFVIAAAPDITKLTRMARDVNDAKPAVVINHIEKAAQGLRQPAIACLGLSYKADIDDLRESPALHIVESLLRAQKGRILVVEPNISVLPDGLKGHAALTLTDLHEAIDTANIIVVLVDHRQFKRVDRNLLAGKTIIDTKGIWR